MKPSEMGIFSIMLLVFALGNAYVLWRLWWLIPATAPAVRVAVVSVGVFLTAAFFIAMFLRSTEVPVWMVSALYRVGTAWTIVFFYLLMIFLAGDLLRLVRVFPEGVMLGNWWSVGILSGAMVVVFVLANINYHNKRRVEINLQADVTQPVRIVAASDLHLGFGIGPRELGRWVDMINREEPDAVVFAGDVIDTGTRPLWKRDYAPQFARLNAPMGVFAALGNHEYISGHSESVRFLEHAGVRVLRDGAAMLPGGVYIIGRDDASNECRKPVAELLAGVDSSSCCSSPFALDGQATPLGITVGRDDKDYITTILLDHQPHNLEEAEAAGVTLQISGHTHRGQVWPATWITDRLFEKSHGEHRRGQTRYFISQGLGIWGGKFRIGSRSEYLVINILPR